jgi:UDP-N-acetylglucosamine--N-acetylmuramyl-(pentapeptide) pyrophosphoryl-undecaprenol N-acetylglucosamine transferase
LDKEGKRINRAIVCGGGTGGHLFPGIATAEAILENFPHSKVLFISTERQVDSRALQNRPFATAVLKCRPLKGLSGLAKLATAIRLPASLIAAAAIIRRFKPDLVLGVGGYVTGPVILAARLLGVSCCIHEQNSVPGLANRLLGRIVRKVFISLPESAAYFPAGKTVLTGNPVRRELLAAASTHLTKESHRPTLLVLGGSQGAHRVNMLIIEALADQRQTLPPELRVIHQTGSRDEEEVRAAYDRLGIRAQVAAFFTDMATLYREADLVVSRAGATTLTELMLFAKPAILIPYPFAADSHQEKNALYLVEHGGAKMFVEAKLTGPMLGREIVRLIVDKEEQERMAGQLATLARPQATESIVAHCLEMI